MPLKSCHGSDPAINLFAALLLRGSEVQQHVG